MGLYSVLISIPLMFLLALSFQVPSKVITLLKSSKNLDELRKNYEDVKTKLIRSRLLGGMVFFILASFLSLYLIAFGQVAQGTVE